MTCLKKKPVAPERHAGKRINGHCERYCVDEELDTTLAVRVHCDRLIKVKSDARRCCRIACCRMITRMYSIKVGFANGRHFGVITRAHSNFF